jgi:hypothetical protein
MFEGKDISDSTDSTWLNDTSKERFAFRVNNLGKSLQERAESLAEAVAASFDFRTERGVGHIVLYNGEFKKEGEAGVQCVLNGDFSAEAQMAAYEKIAEKTLEAMAWHKEHTFGGAGRLVWRRLPTFCRQLCEDGLHLSMTVRFAFD